MQNNKQPFPPALDAQPVISDGAGRITVMFFFVNAIRAAFLPEAVKERLESQLREAIRKDIEHG